MDRALAKDEACLYELCIEFPEPSRDAWLDHYAARRLAELLVWVRFHPDRLPVRVERYQRIDDTEASEEISLSGGASVHALARAFGPGILGIRWEW